MMINLALLQTIKISEKKKKNIEKKKYQIKKPKSLKDLKKLLLSEFNTENLNSIKIYSVDWDGEANEIKDDEDFKNEDSIAFKAIFDKDIPNLDNIDDINQNQRDESNDSISENELMAILDEELNKDKKEEIKFDSKIFSQNLLNEFKNKQKDIINSAKLKIDKNYDTMIEQNKTFLDIKIFPKIRESIIKASTNIIEMSKINNEKKNENSFIFKDKKEIKSEINKPPSNHMINMRNKEEEEKEEEKEEKEIKEEEKDEKEVKEEYDFEFINKEINLEKTKEDAKLIDIDNIDFKNIGKKKFFVGGDLYFFKGEDSSEGIFFVGIRKDKKQGICLEEDLYPNRISKGNNMTICIEEPLIGNNYCLNVIIKSYNQEIKMKDPHKININVIKDKNIIQEEYEKERKDNENEKLEEDQEKNEQNENNNQENKNEKLETQEKNEQNENNNEENENAKEDLKQIILDELEDQFMISNFKPVEEIKEMIVHLNYDREKIYSWIETIM